MPRWLCLARFLGLSTHHGAEMLPKSLLCFDSDGSSQRLWVSLLPKTRRQHNPALGCHTVIGEEWFRHGRMKQTSVKMRIDVCTALWGLHAESQWVLVLRREGRFIIISQLLLMGKLKLRETKMCCRSHSSPVAEQGWKPITLAVTHLCPLGQHFFSRTLCLR